MFTDYFFAKKGETGKLFDPDRDFELFFITFLGYAIKTIYSESDDKETNHKAINRIIELFN
jgi:uncharacterized protein (DUF2225 family)